MANQKGEVEPSQNVPRDHSGVVGLSIRGIGIRSVGGAIRSTIDGGLGCPNASFDSAQRWRYGCRVPIGGNQVIGHILDEKPLALR